MKKHLELFTQGIFPPILKKNPNIGCRVRGVVDGRTDRPTDRPTTQKIGLAARVRFEDFPRDFLINGERKLTYEQLFLW